MSFVERFIILCPYLGEPTIRGSTVYPIEVHSTVKPLKSDTFLIQHSLVRLS